MGGLWHPLTFFVPPTSNDNLWVCPKCGNKIPCMKRLYKLSEELKGNKEKRSYAKRDYVPFEFDMHHERSQGNLKRDQFSDFEPLFSDVRITSENKKVDFINYMAAIQGHGFILSARVRDIFDTYRLPPHKYYPLNIVHPKRGILKSPQFYWLQVLETSYLDFVNFNDSKIYAVKNKYQADEESFDVHSKEQLLEYAEESLTYGIWHDKVIFNKGLNYDLFFAPSFEYDALISEELKSTLEKSEIEGYKKFMEIEIYVE